MTQNHKQHPANQKKLPIVKNEDVEFSQQLADEDDLTAQQRAAAADKRQET